MGLVVSNKQNQCCCNLTDVTLADEDINSILTDNANRAIQGNPRQRTMCKALKDLGN